MDQMVRNDIACNCIPTFSRDLTIPHLDLSHFVLCIMGNVWLVTFNSRTAILTELIVKNSKKLVF